MPLKTWNDLVRDARQCLEQDRLKDFQITGEEAELAERMGIPLDSVRIFILAEAYGEWLSEVRTFHKPS